MKKLKDNEDSFPGAGLELEKTDGVANGGPTSRAKSAQQFCTLNSNPTVKTHPEV